MHGLRLPIISSRFFIALNDILAASVIIALAYAAYRRLGHPPWALTTLPDALVIIGMIGGHLTPLLLSEGFAAAAVRQRGPALVAGRRGPRRPVRRRSARRRTRSATSASGGSTSCS